MITLINENVYLVGKQNFIKATDISALESLGVSTEDIASAKNGSISSRILNAHNIGESSKELNIKFDSLTSHDITYVGVVQTAKSSGLETFPVPYVLTNCHNSLCAVGGTINEDDHLFGLSAAKKYGGIYVPAHLAVIHQYMREMMSRCGSMILGSDSHTRYGALGTMAIGEGGPEIVKQLLGKTYDIASPEIIAVHLTGEVKKGVGPQDVALAIIKAVFANGFVKNKVMEFVGDGISKLSVDFRNGIDVMTTETTCLSSVWETDDKVKKFYAIHGRAESYKKLEPANVAMYDGAVLVDLSKVTPMIAMPFHPSNVYTLKEVIENPYDILKKVEEDALKNDGITLKLTDKIKNGKIHVDQGIIAGCAGGIFENIREATAILEKGVVGTGEFALSVYPSSQPIYIELVKNGNIATLMQQGAVVKTAFCGPCFGAGDVPSNNSFSIRHTTRNFPNREGSKPSNGQIASVALMDARSIAATAANSGILTSAEDFDYEVSSNEYNFDKKVYDSRVFFGYKKAETEIELKYGPNIADWPKIPELKNNILLKMVAVIKDPVTTTDELIPSGETSSYRSNPYKLAEFTLSRKAPQYVGKAKEVFKQEKLREEGKDLASEYVSAIKAVNENGVNGDTNNTYIASAIYAVKPGDGSAREQAASCQRVLGGAANIAKEYATKRYRSNLINWGMLPLISDYEDFREDDFVFIENVREGIVVSGGKLKASLIRDGKVIKNLEFTFGNLNENETSTILEGCLMNFYAKTKK